MHLDQRRAEILEKERRARESADRVKSEAAALADRVRVAHLRKLAVGFAVLTLLAITGGALAWVNQQKLTTALGEVAKKNAEVDRENAALEKRNAEVDRKNVALEKRNAEVDRKNTEQHADPRDEALRAKEETLANRRKMLGPEHPDTLSAMNELAISYADAARLSEALPMLMELFEHQPKNTFLSQKLTTLQAWLRKDSDHAATCRRILELAAGTDDPSVADRAAKAYCLLPSSDPKLLDAALALAQRAVEIGKNHGFLAYY